MTLLPALSFRAAPGTALAPFTAGWLTDPTLEVVECLTKKLRKTRTNYKA
jgi:hypothetical protein